MKIHAITTQIAREAYAALRATPKSGIFNDGNGCMCPIAAVTTHRMGVEGAFCVKDSGAYIVEIARVELGLSRDYLRGFVNGFDRMTYVICSSEVAEYRRGYHDGQACRLFILNGGVPDVK